MPKPEEIWTHRDRQHYNSGAQHHTLRKRSRSAGMTGHVRRNTQLEAVGSGFFATSQDPTVGLLFTARHVLETFEKLGFGHISVGTQILKISGEVGRRVSHPDQDIGVWEIPSDFLIQHGIARLPTLPILSGEEFRSLFLPTSSFIIIGYPAKKNSSLNLRDAEKRERALFGLALHDFTYQEATNEILFFYDDKRITTEKWAPPKTQAPHMEGMSGSPCLRIVVHSKLQRLAVCVAGIFTDWSRREKQLKVCQFGDLWLDRN